MKKCCACCVKTANYNKKQRGCLLLKIHLVPTKNEKQGTRNQEQNDKTLLRPFGYILTFEKTESS